MYLAKYVGTRAFGMQGVTLNEIFESCSRLQVLFFVVPGVSRVVT